MNDLKILREKVKTLSILLVDDDEKILNRSVVFMKKFFESVDTASNVEEALRKFIDYDGYDIVLTDIKMPGMSGWKLIEQLRKIDKNVFISVMTGSSGATEEELLLCNLYLKKPINIDNMIMMIKKIIEKREI